VAIKRTGAGVGSATTAYSRIRVGPDTLRALIGSAAQAGTPAAFADAIERALTFVRAEPAEVITGTAERIGADLILAAGNTRPRLPSWMRSLHNTALIRLCRSPILLVRGEPCEVYRTVVVAIDFSRASLAAARTAALLAPTARFIFVHACRLPEELMMRELDLPVRVLGVHRGRACPAERARLDEFIDLYLRHMPSGTREVRAGRPLDVVANCVHRHSADLLVLGRGATHPGAWLSSSDVMHRLVDDSLCDLLVGADHFGAYDAPRLAA
jgi:nucleotide-binding universal stress UspA family protein